MLSSFIYLIFFVLSQKQLNYTIFNYQSCVGTDQSELKDW